MPVAQHDLSGDNTDLTVAKAGDSQGIGGIQVADIVRPVVPYIIASAIALLIVTLVPGVSTLLPALLG